MTEKQDQRICIKFRFQLGKTSSETIQMMQKAFGNKCMSKTRIKEWYNRLKGGRISVDSEHQSVMLSDLKVCFEIYSSIFHLLTISLHLSLILLIGFLSIFCTFLCHLIKDPFHFGNPIVP